MVYLERDVFERGKLSTADNIFMFCDSEMRFST